MTTRVGPDPTGRVGKGSGDAGSEEQDTRLLARLRQLVADEGRGRAAEHLGVERKTVWRVLNSEQLTPVVREALVNLDTRVSDSDEGGHDDAGVRELRHRIAILEDLLPDVEWQLALVANALAELRESQPAAAVASTPDTPAPPAASPQAKPATYVPRRIYLENVVLEPRPDDEQVYGGEVLFLITEWREQHPEFKAHWPTIPGYLAEIRMVELEVELISEHELTFSSDEPPWPNWRRRQELHDRAERLDVARTKLRKKRIREGVSQVSIPSPRFTWGPAPSPVSYPPPDNPYRPSGSPREAGTEIHPTGLTSETPSRRFVVRLLTLGLLG